jgi:hypothetical protein
MKKVHYMIGVAGVAPALGLMLPAAHVAAAAAHTQGKAELIRGSAGKSVRLPYVPADLSARPMVDCGSSQFREAESTHGHLAGVIGFSGSLCVRFQSVTLNERLAGLTERTRFYSGAGRLERTTWQAGSFAVHDTIFSSYPNMYAHEVCQALVANSNHNDVKFGPICETT